MYYKHKKIYYSHNLMVDSNKTCYFIIYMRYEDFHKRLTRAELSVKEFAGFLGVNPRSISNYSQKGEVPNHLALIALMLAELIKYDVKLKDIISTLSKFGSKPRKRGVAGFRGKTKAKTEPNQVSRI